MAFSASPGRRSAASSACRSTPLIGFCLAPVFASLISLTPARVGAAHAGNAICFQIASAAFGGAMLTGLIGLLIRAFGLEVIGAAVAALALILFMLHEALLRSSRAS